MILSNHFEMYMYFSHMKFTFKSILILAISQGVALAGEFIKYDEVENGDIISIQSKKHGGKYLDASGEKLIYKEGRDGNSKKFKVTSATQDSSSGVFYLRPENKTASNSGSGSAHYVYVDSEDENRLKHAPMSDISGSSHHFSFEKATRNDSGSTVTDTKQNGTRSTIYSVEAGKYLKSLSKANWATKANSSNQKSWRAKYRIYRH